MLVKNMQDVFKIFFRGMKTTRVKNSQDDDYDCQDEIESSLTVLERKKIVQTRVRPDTGVK
jgi:hypothetical protein